MTNEEMLKAVQEINWLSYKVSQVVRDTEIEVLINSCLDASDEILMRLYDEGAFDD